MSYMTGNNMPPVVSPLANAAPNVGPNITMTENIYMYPYPKPRPVNNDAALILVLFILLVIITRGIGFIGKC